MSFHTPTCRLKGTQRYFKCCMLLHLVHCQCLRLSHGLTWSASFPPQFPLCFCFPRGRQATDRPCTVPIVCLQLCLPYDSILHHEISQDTPFPPPLGLCYIFLASCTLSFRHEHHQESAHLKEEKHSIFLDFTGASLLGPPSIFGAAVAAPPTPALLRDALSCCVPVVKTYGPITSSA